MRIWLSNRFLKLVGGKPQDDLLLNRGQEILLASCQTHSAQINLIDYHDKEENKIQLVLSLPQYFKSGFYCWELGNYETIREVFTISKYDCSVWIDCNAFSIGTN